MIATFAAVLTAAGAGYVEFASGSQIQRRWVRIGLALMIPMLPVLRVEVIDEMAEIQFILVFVCFWILLCVSRNRLGQVVAGLSSILIALSTLLVTLLVPIAIFRLFFRKSRRFVPSAFLVGIASHWLLVHLLHTHRSLGVGVPIEQAVRAYGSEVINPLVLGGQFSGEFALGHHTVLLSLAFLASLLLSVAFCRTDRYRYLAVIVLCLAVSFVGYIGEVLGSGVTDRYAVYPELFAIAAIAVALDSNSARRSVFWARAACVLGIVSLACALSFEPTAYRTIGPTWSSSLTTARRSCAHGINQVDVALMPSGWGYASLPCRVVGRD